MSVRRLVALAGALCLVAAVGLIWPTTSGAATAQVDIQDSQFVPNAVTISVGDTVTWTESGRSTHSVTADDASFDSSPSCPPTCLGNGSTFSHTFTAAGTFRYYCRIHGAPGGQGMSGTVTVVAVTPTTPSTTTTAPASTPSVTDPGTTMPSPMAPASPAPAVQATAALTG